MRGRRIFVASLLALGGLAASITVGAEPSVAASTWAFRTPQISFRYPTQWKVRRASATGSFAMAMAKFSTEGFNIPCEFESCWVPSGGRLRPGGIFGYWEARSQIDWNFYADAPGSPLSLAGLDMRWNQEPADPWCRGMGGTESVAVLVNRNTPNNWYQMTACLRRPIAGTAAQIRSMLATVRFPHVGRR